MTLRSYTSMHDDARSAQAIALEVARRLKDRNILERAATIAVQQSFYPALAEWRPHSLSQGGAGLAVLFEYMESCYPGQGWDVEARWHLEAAARSVEETPGLGMSLYGQLGGVAFAAWYLSRGGRRYRRLSTTLDEVLCSRIEAAADALDAMSGGCPVQLFDLISGVTGAGVYLLCRSEQEGPRRTLEHILRCLVSLTAEDEGLPRWRTPRHLLLGEDQARDFPNGNLNCGLAHGIPGPLGLMSLAKLRAISVPGMDEGIERIVDWLLVRRLDDQHGAMWPAFYPLPGPGDSRGGEVQPLPCKSAWCYGSPGVCRALYMAGQALAKPDLCQIAIDAMRSAVTRPVDERHVPSPTFCHGVAGRLQVTLRFFMDTGLPVFEQAMRAQLAQLVDAYEPASILGFRSIEPNGVRVDNPGLLDGAPGVCLAMLAATTPSEPTWDRFLLLS
ncbi:lanthionine synthetase C family protein [Sorangium sp. So ce448]|uniref:lanthionine synthetase C family protein n=1 Tax=Sorangium sp. So ce448 TaxID=3133314 RepID=UPI003F604448